MDDSGIVNDPNGWFENPRDLITAIKWIVYVSVESTKIIENLPSEATSSAVGAKVLGKRSEGTLPSVSPIGCVENKAKTAYLEALQAGELTHKFVTIAGDAVGLLRRVIHA